VATNRPFFGGRTAQWAASASIAILAAAVVLVLVNYLSARHYRRWDWTSSGLYSLSEKSRQILKAADRLKAPIHVTAVLASGTPEQEIVRELLENYAVACPAIAVEYLDPAADPLKAEAIVKRLGLQSDKVVIFESGGRTKQVDITEFLDYDYSGAAMGGGPPRIQSFKGEAAFTGAVLSVTQDKQSAVCFTKGHEELPWQGGDDHSASKLADFLKTENYRLEDWDSLSGAAVPTDCSALVIAGPRRAFLESEVREMRAYLDRGGRVAALLDPELSRQDSILDTGLEALLADYGVTLGRDLVVDRGDPRILLLGAGPETLVIRDLPSHPATRNLTGTAAILPVTRSVTPAPQPHAGLTVTTIARTSEEGWAERDLASLTTGISKGPEDLAGPVSVGVAVERTADATPTAAATTGAATTGAAASAARPKARLVVFGDSDFISNAALLRLGNLDLALNSLHWLTEKDALIGIEPRQPEQVVLTMTPEQGRALILIVLLGLPAMAAAGGLSVWWRRRS